MEFVDYLKQRRSIYALGAEISLADAEIEQLISGIIENTPSAFNSQSQKVLLLFGESHHRLWDIVGQELKKIVPEADFPRSKANIDSFRKARGSVVFFDDEGITKNLMERFPLYKHNFPVWAEQQNGMLQTNIWVALSNLAIGGSLQHYNELIEAEVKRTFAVPEGWRLIAQMPFGSIKEIPEAQPRVPITERLIVKK